MESCGRVRWWEQLYEVSIAECRRELVEEVAVGRCGMEIWRLTSQDVGSLRENDKGLGWITLCFAREDSFISAGLRLCQALPHNSSSIFFTSCYTGLISFVPISFPNSHLSHYFHSEHFLLCLIHIIFRPTFLPLSLSLSRWASYVFTSSAAYSLLTFKI